MEELVDWISGLEGPAPTLVVHLGAGSGAVVGRWQSLPAERRPARLVLVEGDPEAAEMLRREAAALPWVQVVTTAVAPAAGPLAWHRFSLSAVNGPLDGSGLAAYYPRLRQLASTRVEAMTLGDVLAPLLPADERDDGIVVLAFDIPGQEAALLQSLPDELLQRCSAVAVRGCKVSPGPGGQPLDSTVASLRTRMFALAHAEHEREPLWPLAWLGFNRTALELQRLRATLTERETQVTALSNEQAELRTQVQQRTSELEELRAKLAGRDEQLTTLASAHAGQQAQLQQGAEQLDGLRARLVQSEQHVVQATTALEQLRADRSTELADRDRQIAELSKSREWHKRVGAEREARLDALVAQHAGVHEAQRALAAEVDALKPVAGRAEEQQRRADQLAQELETLRDEAGKLKVQRDEFQKTSTEAKRSLSASRTQVAMKQRRIEELEAELQQLRHSQGSLDDEIARAEGQLDLIKDLLLLTPQSRTA